MPRLSPELEIWRGLLRGQRSMLLRLVATLKREADLTTAQYEALLSLREAGGALGAADLSHLLLYSSGSTTHLVARLEERGLVVRTRGDVDARQLRIALTDVGVALIEKATAAHTADIEAQFAPLIHDEERDALLAFARRLAAAEGVTSQPADAAPGPPR